jgi:hypothetical protein
VQVGSLFPPGPELPLDQLAISREKPAQSEAPSRSGDATAARGATVGSARTPN